MSAQLDTEQLNKVTIENTGIMHNVQIKQENNHFPGFTEAQIVRMMFHAIHQYEQYKERKKKM
jgi:hypothetical protein